MREKPREIRKAQVLVQEPEDRIGRVRVRDEREAPEARHAEEVVRIPERVVVAGLERVVGDLGEARGGDRVGRDEDLAEGDRIEEEEHQARKDRVRPERFQVRTLRWAKRAGTPAAASSGGTRRAACLFLRLAAHAASSSTTSMKRRAIVSQSCSAANARSAGELREARPGRVDESVLAVTTGRGAARPPRR